MISLYDKQREQYKIEKNIANNEINNMNNTINELNDRIKQLEIKNNYSENKTILPSKL